MAVWVGVSVVAGVLVAVGVLLNEGVSVGDEVKVTDGDWVAVRVAVGLMKNSRIEIFEESTQAASRSAPRMKLNTQKPATNRPSDFDPVAGITRPPTFFGAIHPVPC